MGKKSTANNVLREVNSTSCGHFTGMSYSPISYPGIHPKRLSYIITIPCVNKHYTFKTLAGAVYSEQFWFGIKTYLAACNDLKVHINRKSQ